MFVVPLIVNNVDVIASELNQLYYTEYGVFLVNSFQ